MIAQNKTYICANDPGPRWRLGTQVIKTQYKDGIPYFLSSDDGVHRWCKKFSRIFREVPSIDEYIKSLPKQEEAPKKVVTEDKPDGKQDYSIMKFQDLKKLASKIGLKPDPSLSKKELIVMLERFNVNPSIPQGESSKDN